MTVNIEVNLSVAEIESILDQIGVDFIRKYLNQQDIKSFDCLELEDHNEEQQSWGRSDVTTDSFDDQELIDKLEQRGYAVFEDSQEVDKIAQALRCGQDCHDMIRSYFENLTGKIL